MATPQGVSSGDPKAIQEMQAKLDRAFDINARKANDMIRLKQYIERLRCDFQMLTFNKKQGRLAEEGTTDDIVQESSNDSDKMVNDQITSTLELITKILEANL